MSSRKNIRIIPRLEIKGDKLIKGIQLEGLRVVGEPAFCAKKYYEAGADELIYSDVVASLYGRNSLIDVISNAASQIFIPLTVGGGINSTNDVRPLLGMAWIRLDKKGSHSPTRIDKSYCKPIWFPMLYLKCKPRIWETTIGMRFTIMEEKTLV